MQAVEKDFMINFPQIICTQSIEMYKCTEEGRTRMNI